MSSPSRGEIERRLRDVEDTQPATPSAMSAERWDELARVWWVLPRVPPSLWPSKADTYLFELTTYGHGREGGRDRWASLSPIEAFAAREAEFHRAGVVAAVEGEGVAPRWTEHFEFETLTAAPPSGFEWPDDQERPVALPPSAYTADLAASTDPADPEPEDAELRRE